MKKIKEVLKKKLNKKTINFIKKIFTTSRRAFNMARFYINRKKYILSKFLNRIIKKKYSDGLSFAILCIKKTEYADMIINNANSLHYINPNHIFFIYCDETCLNYLKTKKIKFNYPEKINLINFVEKADKAWQFYKIEIHIIASLKNQISVDADSIWHKEPKLDNEKITMFLKQRKMRESEMDISVIKNILKNINFLEFDHFVASFIHIPSQKMTQQLQNDIRKYNELIFNNKMDFLTSEDDKDDAKRLSEQYAMNFSLQSNFPNETIVTIEDSGLGSKKILEALSYGYLNKVIE